MEIDQSNKDFVTYDGILYSSDYELAYVVPAGIVGPVRMPEPSPSFPAVSSAECKNLKGVIFHDKITAIGDSAFAYCTGLETLTIGKNVTNIMENAFIYAGNKDTVINFETGSKYAYVKKDAFYRLTAKEINLPASAVTFDGEAFRMCEAEVKSTRTPPHNCCGGYVQGLSRNVHRAARERDYHRRESLYGCSQPRNNRV